MVYNKNNKNNKKRRSRIVGVKRDNVPFAGGERGGRSPPKEVAKAAKRTFAAGLDLLSLKQSKLQIHNRRPDIFRKQNNIFHDMRDKYEKT